MGLSSSRTALQPCSGCNVVVDGMTEPGTESSQRSSRRGVGHCCEQAHSERGDSGAGVDIAYKRSQGLLRVSFCENEICKMSISKQISVALW